MPKTLAEIQELFHERLNANDAAGIGLAAPVDQDSPPPPKPPEIPEAAEAKPSSEPTDEEIAAAAEHVEPAEEPEAEEPSEQEAASQEDSPEEEPPVETLAELAEVLQVEGLDEDALAEQLHIENADGERVSLSEVIEFYHSGPSSEIAISQQVDERTAEKVAQLDAHEQQLTAVTGALIQQYEGVVNAADLEHLKTQDPGRYIQVTDQLTMKRREIESGIEALAKLQKDREAEAEQVHEKWAEQEARNVLKRMPTWRNEKIRDVAATDIDDYMTKYKATDEQKENLQDSLAIVTVWKAAQYDKALAKKSGVLKRVRTLPSRKALAQSARRDHAPEETAQKRRAAQVDRLRQSGRVEDAVDLFAELVEN